MGSVGDAMKSVRDKVIDKQGVTDPSVIHFRVKDLLEFSNNNAYLYQLFYPFGFHQWDDIKSLLVSQSGKQMFSKTHRLVKHRDYLLLSEINQNHADTAAREIQDSDSLINLDVSSLEMETIKSSGSEFNKKLSDSPKYALF